MKTDLSPDPKAMYVQGSRLLGPFELDKFISAIPKLKHRTIFNFYLWSGVRYIEGQRIHDNPGYYVQERQTRHLPKEAQKKEKQKIKNRYIPVKGVLTDTIDYYLEGSRPPSVQSWDRNLKVWAEKAGFNPYGFNARMTRKIKESYLLTAGVPEIKVYLMQGHDPITSLRHYQGLAFTREEEAEIKRRVSPWME